MAIFHYKAQTAQDKWFQMCIQIDEMKEALWKYAYHGQVILGGTFGVCDYHVLLFIALGVNETGKDIPLVFFLFSALIGNRATQAGYDTAILHELLKEWQDSLGVWNGVKFTPLMAITDTGIKEQGALPLCGPTYG
ncbi:hypothetical protein K439DRAFT_1612565 [Ramaria rubella]|nr:hypothetical protein K439DRAFT_1612565 [Ramaria rubella]